MCLSGVWRLYVIMGLAGLLALAGCGDGDDSSNNASDDAGFSSGDYDAGEDKNVEIMGLDLLPTRISHAEIAENEVDNDLGYLRATIDYKHMRGDLDNAYLFAQLRFGDVEAKKRELTRLGGTSALLDVDLRFLRDPDTEEPIAPGTYELGTRVVSERGEYAEAFSLATITIRCNDDEQDYECCDPETGEVEEAVCSVGQWTCPRHQTRIEAGESCEVNGGN